MRRHTTSNVKDIERAQEILRRCDQERKYSRVRLNSVDSRERVSFSEQRILESAKLNPCAAKYVNKQGVSSYLRNPILYSKLLQSVQRKKMTSQSMFGRQFLIRQERLLRKSVDMSEYLGFR